MLLITINFQNLILSTLNKAVLDSMPCRINLEIKFSTKSGLEILDSAPVEYFSYSVTHETRISFETR